MQTPTIKFSQTKTQQLNPQIFTIWSDEIEGRIDPEYSNPAVGNPKENSGGNRALLFSSKKIKKRSERSFGKRKRKSRGDYFGIKITKPILCQNKQATIVEG